MKYEKYLTQIIRSMCKLANITRDAVENSYALEGDIFEQMQTIKYSLNVAHHNSEVLASFDAMLSVPKKFIEQSKATTAEAIFKQYYKEQEKK